MKKTVVLPPDIEQLLKTLELICHDLAFARFDRVAELFELTRDRVYPQSIGNLAESFGMMLIRLEAREYQMDRIMQELRRTGKALEASRRQLLQENKVLKRELTERFSTSRIVGQSAVMRQILNQVTRIADTTVNVLITGETGTGKELIAKALHYNSLRRSGPFVAINCSAVPENLFESELFGIEKGVATGVAMRRGLIEQAHGGTLFLDEIGDMPLTVQPKILRVIETRELTRVGGAKVIPVDIRLVTATHKDLQAEIDAERFRRDLYFRLNVICLTLPPLRARREDIPLLVKRFLEIHCRAMNRPLLQLSADITAAFANYAWPGNIRELENEIERLVALTCTPLAESEDLSSSLQAALPSNHGHGLATEDTICGHASDSPHPVAAELERESTPMDLAETEARAIKHALEFTQGNKARAARLLGISREGLRKKIQKLGTQR